MKSDALMQRHPLIAQLAIVVTFLLMSGCAAIRQTDEEVAIRPPGHRFLTTPVFNNDLANEHWQYAWLSDASYKRAVDGEAEEICAATSPDEVLVKQGWTRWKDFPLPGDHLDSAMRRSHLRAEVWENAQRKEIVVSFGGTDSKNDWKSNLRWFTFKVDDEYTLLVKGFSPAFIDEMEKRAQHQDHEWLLHSKLISTGHSLGGGLAQQFAYALPTRNAHIKVAQVYAFDPSPVTGFFSVDKALRDKNRQGLLIDRIYERGEILALLRSFTSMFVKPAAVDPRIRGVRYSLLSQGNAITYHSMHDFACHLQKAAGMGVGDLL